MDVFKQGLPFERALEALKEGKSIRRKKSYSGLTKMLVSSRGTNQEKFCEYYLDGREGLRQNPVLDIEDIIANDWIIED